MTWPAEVAPALQEDGYRTAIKEVLSSCHIEVENPSVVCEEPPCIAVLDGITETGNTFNALADCSAWSKRYGTQITGHSSNLKCDSDVGEGRRVYLLSPPTKRVWPSATPPEENANKRLAFRHKVLQEQLCAGEITGGLD